MNKMIKHLLFTWFEEQDAPELPGGKNHVERLARLGEEVDITNPAYIRRGEDPKIDAFYSDADAEAIRKGTYRGYDAEAVYRARGQGLPATTPLGPGQDAPVGVLPPGEDADGNTVPLTAEQLEEMDSEQLSEYIKDNKLTAPQTVALVGEGTDPDLINKVLDAEGLATNNTPRATVVGPLEKKLTGASLAS